MILWEALDLNAKFINFNFLNGLGSREFNVKTLKRGMLNGDYTVIM